MVLYNILRFGNMHIIPTYSFTQFSMITAAQCL